MAPKELKRKKPLPPVPPKGNQYAKGNPGPPRDKLTIPEIYTLEKLKEEAAALMKWFDEPRNIWLKRFAIDRGYEPSRLWDFAEKSPEFAVALKKAHEMQQAKLVEMGLFKQLDSNLTKFVLQNVHNWKEKTEVSGDAQNPISFLLNTSSNRSKELNTYDGKAS